MIVLLDTCVLIDALNGRRGRSEWLDELLAKEHIFACCPITIAEVFAGMHPREAVATEEFFDRLDYFGIGTGVARRAGVLKFEWARKGLTLGLPDVLIAAVALEHGLSVATDNRKDFPMPELKILVPPQIQ